MGVAEMPMIRHRLELVYFWYPGDPIKNTRLLLVTVLQGWYSEIFIYRLPFSRARKSAEVRAFAVLCQVPVPRASAVEGQVIIDLDNFTSFGSWICSMIVLHTHQKVRKFPSYQEQPADVPLAVFQFVENLAIAFRPHVHPEYHLSLM